MTNAQEEESSEEEQVEQSGETNFFDQFIISRESEWKSVFDIWVLVLVGYSCIASLYYVAFSSPTKKAHIYWEWVVEIFFYSDLILNFF